MICPASLLGTWEREVRRFSPDVPVRRYHGGGRHLEDLAVERVLAMGESQSAFRLSTYVNEVDAAAAVYDGFLVHARGGSIALPCREPGFGEQHACFARQRGNSFALAGRGGIGTLLRHGRLDVDPMGNGQTCNKQDRSRQQHGDAEAPAGDAVLPIDPLQRWFGVIIRWLA